MGQHPATVWDKLFVRGLSYLPCVGGRFLIFILIQACIVSLCIDKLALRNHLI